jgi:hypothetical protein
VERQRHRCGDKFSSEGALRDGGIIGAEVNERAPAMRGKLHALAREMRNAEPTKFYFALLRVTGAVSAVEWRSWVWRPEAMRADSIAQRDRQPGYGRLLGERVPVWKAIRRNRRLAGLSRLAGLNRQTVMEADEGCLGHSNASIRYASRLHRSPSSVYTFPAPSPAAAGTDIILVAGAIDHNYEGDAVEGVLAETAVETAAVGSRKSKRVRMTQSYGNS